MVEIEPVKKDFLFLFSRNEILAILLYGSVAKGEDTPQSDIDICIVAPSCKDKKGLLNEIYRKLDVYSKKYDVRFFEELPLYIQINIIENNRIIYSKNVYDLYEYFYYFRKLWNEQEMRQKVTAAEMVQILS
ncbi:MAG: nucleotidyltransferase domain-containing protein [Euryarchaeota archaeon]|nr:nucleotidyltransferase domain-containing protein [Euryarchaeota archaeon]MBU4340138.1 nucleotidyltransferase domain-containing protein [Euryarchaeota archaeon]MBU4453612.1 nucleotidyltransferase domain-containing protein [Euryarchaeota archaeon]MCG2737876.1 nucleotidyltransferase domain-containing protein [Candidatus Methanoperedenaceae archaeon]